MTEKRFTIENVMEMKDNWNINKRCYHFGNGFDANDCCNMLNELQEENKRLKSINQDYCNYIGDFEDDFIRLADENKELKKQVDEMVNIFNDSGLDYHISDELEEILND